MTTVINKWYMSLICRDVKPENILIDTVHAGDKFIKLLFV